MDQTPPPSPHHQHHAQDQARPASPYPLPPPHPPPPEGTNPWMTHIFGCMEDLPNALITLLFPCVTFGQIAEVLDYGNTTCVTSGIMYAISPCMISRPYRTKLRRMFGLVEAPSSDWLVHFMFEPCALCQEYRELSRRGINPALGYHGNEERDNQLRVPPGNQTMV